MRAAWGMAIGSWVSLLLAPGISLAQTPEPPRGGHAYAMLGGGSASEGGNTGVRALQLSFGQHVGERVRCDATYVNEGHPRNNHRDGFGAQCWMGWRSSPGIRMEVGAGPYLGMNATTPPGGTAIDEKQLGLLASAAILYRVGTDTHVRAQYNHVAVPGAHRSNTLMVGLGMDFGGRRVAAAGAGGETEVGLWAGAAETSRPGQSAGTGWQIEARRPYTDATAYSISALSESQGSGMLDREGVALQGWWVKRVAEKWTLNAGVGPMFARDGNLSGDRNKVLGVISFEAAREIGDRTTASARFNRIVSNYDKDADQFMIGFARKF